MPQKLSGKAIHLIRTLTILPLLLCGCTVVKVENGDIHRSLGLAEVSPINEKLPTIIQTSTYGISASKNSLLIGYRNATVITIPIDGTCNIFIFIDNDDQDKIEDWRQFFESNPDICVIGGGR